MARKDSTLRAVTLTVLVLLLTACAQPSIFTAPPPEPPRTPALPEQARQPKPPSICLPTCSQGLTRLREKSRNSLMLPTQQGLRASDQPMR